MRRYFRFGERSEVCFILFAESVFGKVRDLNTSKLLEAASELGLCWAAGGERKCS